MTKPHTIRCVISAWALLAGLSFAPFSASADPSYTLHGIAKVIGGATGTFGVGPITSAAQFCEMLNPRSSATNQYGSLGPNFSIDLYGTYSESTYCEWTRRVYAYIGGGQYAWVDAPNVKIAMVYLQVNCPTPVPGQRSYTYTPITASFCPQFFVQIQPLPDAQCDSCDSNSVGDPINPASGAVFHTEADVSEPNSSLSFKRFYNSTQAGTTGLSAGWRHSFSRSVRPRYQALNYRPWKYDFAHSPLYSDAGAACTSGFAQIKANVINWQNTTVSFSNGLCSISSGANTLGELPLLYASPQLPTPAATLLGFDVTRDDGQVIRFLMQGSTIVAPPGITLRLQQSGSGYIVTDTADNVESYNSAGRLLSVTGRAGLAQTVSYDGSNRLSAVTEGFGRTLTLSYDALDRLQSATDPNQSATQYGYDSSGRLATVTKADGSLRTYVYENASFPNALTGIVDESNNRFSTWTYDSQGRAASTTEANGAGATFLTYNLDGSVKVTDAFGAVRTFSYGRHGNRNLVTGISGSKCPTCREGKATAYNLAGFIVSRSDYNNRVTQYTNDNARGLETSRTEAYGTPHARTIATQWHATYRLPTQIDEPGKRTTYTHDANGNVLTKTELDTATSTVRTWTYTYNSYGQVLTADGSRTDAADVTTYTYYSCSTGYQCGQVHTITNGLGHVTSYGTYNAHGQPLTITDPNGVVTTLTYDLRQRLTSRTVGSELTSFAYWPTGLLKKATLPDGSYLEYTYDAAHRLTGINDAEGNRIAYTLDAMGNRTAEQLYDPSNALTQTRTRVFNTLNQLWKEIGAAGTANVTTSYAYDNNGNQTGIAAPLGRNTSQTYDELNRLTQVTDPLLGVIQYGYNALDQLISVTDPRSKVTSYSYNALGDLTQQVSPDTGTTTNTYDSGGNLATRTDARSKTATYAYDALNRVTSLAYLDQAISYSYDSGSNQKGRLTQVSDASGATSWTYDPHGRTLSRQQSMGITKTLSYAYDANGRLQTLTLPSGNALTYGYTDGKVTSLTLNGATTILSNVLYQPFGPTMGWTWGNATLAVREYDTDGKVTDIDSAGLKTYGYDDASRITGITDPANASLSQSYSYDLLDRLTSATGTGLNQGWSYDANGNRLSQTGSSSSTYSVASTSNRLTSITGALTRSYSYDNSGNTTSDGTATFIYNDAGRMISATKAGTTATYAINALGQRVKKTASGTSTYFVYDEAGRLTGEYDNSGALIQETVWFGDTPVATLKPNGGGVNVFYIHTDHLNTPRRISRPSDNIIVWRWDGDPFGASAANDDPDNDAQSFVYGLRLPGQHYDSETQLHYNYFRDYDPAKGGYNQSDPIGLEGGINTYAYAQGNPISYSDPLGLETQPRVVPWWWPVIPARPPGGWVEEDVVQDLLRPIMETSRGNVADTQIKQDYEKYASAERLCGKEPKDRCTWLEENKSRYRADQVKATQKAWGCRRSRALR
jgi:RHS repeat-associated protein